MMELYLTFNQFKKVNRKYRVSVSLRKVEEKTIIIGREKNYMKKNKIRRKVKKIVKAR